MPPAIAAYAAADTLSMTPPLAATPIAITSAAADIIAQDTIQPIFRYAA